MRILVCANQKLVRANESIILYKSEISSCKGEYYFVQMRILFCINQKLVRANQKLVRANESIILYKSEISSCK